MKPLSIGAVYIYISSFGQKSNNWVWTSLLKKFDELEHSVKLMNFKINHYSLFSIYRCHCSFCGNHNTRNPTPNSIISPTFSIQSENNFISQFLLIFCWKVWAGLIDCMKRKNNWARWVEDKGYLCNCLNEILGELIFRIDIAYK